MRRLILLPLAVLLALLPAPVHALTAACNPADTIDQVYLNSYQATSTYVTGGDGGQHQLNIDLATYRLSEGTNCYMGGYVSTWFTSHSDFGYHDPRIAFSTLDPSTHSYTNGPWIFDRGTFWDWGNFVWTNDNNLLPGVWGPWTSYTRSVTLPNGQLQPMGFGVVCCGTRSAGYWARTTDSRVYDGCVGGCHFDITSTPSIAWYVEMTG